MCLRNLPDLYTLFAAVLTLQSALVVFVACLSEPAAGEDSRFGLFTQVLSWSLCMPGELCRQ
jgi:hypothetical protein